MIKIITNTREDKTISSDVEVTNSNSAEALATLRALFKIFKDNDKRCKTDKDIMKLYKKFSKSTNVETIQLDEED